MMAACRRLILVVISLLALGWTMPAAMAQAKPAPARGLAVDVVTLKNGRTFRGAVLQKQSDGALTLIVSRTWMRKANSQQCDELEAENRETQLQAWKQARDRLTELLAATPADQLRRSFFLKQELDRIEQRLAAPRTMEPEFLWVELAAAQMAKLSAAPPERQALAVRAWSEQLADVETRDAASLLVELKAKKISLEAAPPDLSHRLPARLQDECEWAARVAVIDYAYCDAVDFQGTSETLLRTGSGQQPDLTAVFQQLMQQQLNSTLADLLGDGKKVGPAANKDEAWLKPAIQQTRDAGANGFRVTRLQLAVEQMQVTVETRFVARMPDDHWQTVWMASESADGTRPRPQDEARIENDPQVQKTLGALKATGIAADAAVKQALRVGAATMAAQQAADKQFFAFRERYIFHIDTPKLFLPR